MQYTGVDIYSLYFTAGVYTKREKRRGTPPSPIQQRKKHHFHLDSRSVMNELREISFSQATKRQCEYPYIQSHTDIKENKSTYSSL